jgi:hypothetical protein
VEWPDRSAVIKSIAGMLMRTSCHGACLGGRPGREGGMRGYGEVAPAEVCVICDTSFLITLIA